MAIKKSELYSSLWSSCDDLRGGMDASEYKNFEAVPFLYVLPQASLVGHPNFLHYAARGGVAAKVGSVNTVEAKLLKGVLQNPARCFGAVTPVPVGLANPVAHFSIGVRLAKHEADAPYIGNVGPTDDGECHTISSVKHRLA